MKRIILLVITILLAFSLLSCFEQGAKQETEKKFDQVTENEFERETTEDNKQVPIYEGMTVYSAATAGVGERTISATPTIKLLSAGNVKMLNADNADYYADLGEDIYIAININNPDDFEILSFTLNGEKYSSYMFEYGSNMSKIIIKCNVGRNSGEHNYTIDAIKYINKQTIRDVILRGDKTIKVVVSEYENEANCNHDDSNKITILESKASTCLSEGVTEGKKCERCNTIILHQEVTPKIPCEAGDWIVDKEATLMELGLMHTECKMCGKKMEEKSIPTKGSVGLEYTVNEDGACTIVGMGTCTDSALIIPAYIEGYKVIGIGEGAFYNSNAITSVYISDFVATIGKNAFYGCTSLKDVTFPVSLKAIGDSAFASCGKVENVYYNGNISEWCAIELGSGWSNPVGYSAQLYFNGELVTDLVIPDNITRIKHHTFFGCASITSLVIGDGVTVIEDQAFSSCRSLKEIVIGKSVKIIDDCAFEATAISSIVIPDSVESIGCEAFYHCKSLTSVVIGKSVVEIEPGIVGGCSSLKYIIYNGTLSQWEAIDKESLCINEGSDYFIACTDGFADKYGNSCYPTGNCLHNDLDKMYIIPETNSSCIENGLTYGIKCSICDEFVVSQQSKPLSACRESEWIIEKKASPTENGKAYSVCTVCGKTVDEVTFAYGSSGLTYSVNGDRRTCTITGIGTCTDRELIIPEFIDNYKVTAIGTSAFRDCLSFSSLKIPNTVEHIYAFAFYGCESLAKVVMSDSVVIIGKWAFAWCESLVSVTISNSVKLIPERAFYYCRSLTNLSIGNSVESIDEYAFEGCASLMELTIPNSVKSIGQHAFSLCKGLKIVTFSDSLAEIGVQAFSNCSSLESVVIPKSVAIINTHAFAFCSLLTIKCEIDIKPIEWHTQWNASNRPVIWDYKGE